MVQEGVTMEKTLNTKKEKKTFKHVTIYFVWSGVLSRVWLFKHTMKKMKIQDRL